MLTALTAAFALLASAFAADGQPAPGAAPQAPAATPASAPAAGGQNDDDASRVVCRRERVLGSNRPQRICLTRAEWDHERDAAREARDRSLRDSPFSQGESGGGTDRSFGGGR